MKLYTIDTGFFKLDGGAMFGVVPKSIWNKLNPADENNMCTWAMRCLLIEHGSRRILIDTGIGSKQHYDFLRHFYLHGDDTLQKSLLRHGFQMEDITDVILTHLHFDHVGGAVNFKNEIYELAFPRATYWVHSDQLKTALMPNAREKASFLKENIQPLVDAEVLGFVDHIDNHDVFSGILEFVFVDGHTEKQILPLIKYKDFTVLFAADLIPSLGHIALPYIMSYDMCAAKTLLEKSEILDRAAFEKWYLFLEHDPLVEVCSLKLTEKGVRVDKVLRLADLVE